jgi:acetyl esterase/lipase
VLELQREPDPSVAVDDIELAGPAGAMAARVYRLRHGRRQAVLYLHGGVSSSGREATRRRYVSSRARAAA